MKSFKKTILVFVSIVLVLSIVVGCSAGKSENSSVDTAVSDSASSEPSESEEAEFGGESTSPLEPEKVITTVELRLETTEFEQSNDELINIIEKHKAYVEYSNISYSSRNFRNGDFVIRVPKESIQSFKSDLNEIGNKTWESTNKQDVTKQYTDTESRLKVIEVKEERILTLMEKANKIEDIIALEEQLSEVIYDKERLKSSLMDLDDKVDFSTINIYLQEVEKLTSSTTLDTSFGSKILDAFNDSLYFFKNTLEKLVILLIYLLPFIIILGVIGFVVHKGMVKYRKK
ncbi:DUF4349 domain-containing protein [Schnuerera sp.]|uniref:DUF4349 domain-containing protein n=1 Tax=Schnuerera sp. TaxID=2794844 RepID=UPI002BCBAB0E|nr:DUF4349 domain-containing protein [Schnuerera sp.]HSH36107.1 DUF4349 domain-containing protein [Schnuerera sp.]